MQRQTLEVDHDDHQRERKSNAPEHITSDDRPQCVLHIRKDLGNDGARRRRDNAADDGKKPDSRHRR